MNQSIKRSQRNHKPNAASQFRSPTLPGNNVQLVVLTASIRRHGHHSEHLPLNPTLSPNVRHKIRLCASMAAVLLVQHLIKPVVSHHHPRMLLSAAGRDRFLAIKADICLSLEHKARKDDLCCCQTRPRHYPSLLH